MDAVKRRFQLADVSAMLPSSGYKTLPLKSSFLDLYFNLNQYFNLLTTFVNFAFTTVYDDLNIIDLQYTRSYKE